MFHYIEPALRIFYSLGARHVSKVSKLRTKVNHRLDPLRLEGVNRALIRKLSGDTGTDDISRVLRVPGTYNLKLTNNPGEVTVVWSDGPRYDYEQFVELAKAENEIKIWT